MLPIYKWWQLPYYWAGCKAYDMLAGGENMESSYIMTKGRALEAFPMLKSEGLVGALVYYDGQYDVVFHCSYTSAEEDSLFQDNITMPE
jgi:glycerol-3-phosphate dehydrogenase